jgi:hypothetical protein
MAALDYTAIETELADIVQAGLPGCRVLVEDDLVFGAEDSPQIVIFFERRDLAPNQRLAAGRRVDYHLRFSIWVWVNGLEARAAAVMRNEIIGKLELILMRDRTVRDMVETGWIEGGEMANAKDPQNTWYIAGGEVVFVAVTNATLED